MADNASYFLDTRLPFSVGPTDIGAVTLAATAKALYTPSAFPVLGGQYWTTGKRMWLHLWGRMTTGATPGNGSFNVYYGDGTDANGVVLATGTPVALSANATALSWTCDLFVKCVTPGSVGTLFCSGYAQFNVGLLASTLAPMFIPASTPAVSGACDLTVAKIISIQFLRSGSTAETMQVHDYHFVPMN